MEKWFDEKDVEGCTNIILNFHGIGNGRVECTMSYFDETRPIKDQCLATRNFVMNIENVNNFVQVVVNVYRNCGWDGEILPFTFNL